METTRSSRKSQTRSGWMNGAMNPPDAASTCTGTDTPLSVS